VIVRITQFNRNLTCMKFIWLFHIPRCNQ